jgi:hypothetical protein
MRLSRGGAPVAELAVAREIDHTKAVARSVKSLKKFLRGKPTTKG